MYTYMYCTIVCRVQAGPMANSFLRSRMAYRLRLSSTENFLPTVCVNSFCHLCERCSHLLRRTDAIWLPWLSYESDLKTQVPYMEWEKQLINMFKAHCGLIFHASVSVYCQVPHPWVLCKSSEIAWFDVEQRHQWEETIVPEAIPWLFTDLFILTRTSSSSLQVRSILPSDGFETLVFGYTHGWHVYTSSLTETDCGLLCTSLSKPTYQVT